MNTGAGVGPVGREEAQEAQEEEIRIQELGVGRAVGPIDVARPMWLRLQPRIR
jgi:hypothetical protein